MRDNMKTHNKKICVEIRHWCLHHAHGRILAAKPDHWVIACPCESKTDLRFAAMNGVAADSRLSAYPDPRPSEAEIMDFWVGMFPPGGCCYCTGIQFGNFFVWDCCMGSCFVWGKRKICGKWLWTFETVSQLFQRSSILTLWNPKGTWRTQPKFGQ